MQNFFFTNMFKTLHQFVTLFSKKYYSKIFSQRLRKTSLTQLYTSFRQLYTTLQYFKNNTKLVHKSKQYTTFSQLSKSLQTKIIIKTLRHSTKLYNTFTTLLHNFNKNFTTTLLTLQQLIF